MTLVPVLSVVQTNQRREEGGREGRRGKERKEGGRKEGKEEE